MIANDSGFEIKMLSTEAAKTGFYYSEIWQKNYPKLQILTIEQLLNGERVQMPPAYGTFKKAEKIKGTDGTQGELGI